MGRAIIIICCGVVFLGSMAIDWLAPKPAPPPVAVRVIGAGVSRVPFLDEFGRVQFTAPYFAVTVGVKDLSTTRKIDFESWRGSAVLEDNFGNAYREIAVTPLRNPGLLEQAPDEAEIMPSSTFCDWLVFERPVPGAKLSLRLPASNYGGRGWVKVQLP